MDIQQIKPQKYQGQIIDKAKLSSKTYLFKIVLQEPQTMPFVSGQFINVTVADKITRQYSIASSPDHSEFIELLVDVSPGGPGSKFFDAKKVNDQISFVGPMGKFTLVEDAGPIIFLASGTGIAPFKSMIEYTIAQQWSLPQEHRRQMYLYFGFRYNADVFWNDYFVQLSQSTSQFHYLLTLSQPDEQWNGCKGYVQSCIDVSVFSHQNASYYICGGQRMVTGALEFLREKQVAEDRIHFEPF